MRTYFTILLIFYLQILFCQEGRWYLNPDMYLDFTLSPITLIESTTDIDLSGYEDAISINSELGEFLYYSNGNRIWDKNFEIMPNGDDLNGWVSSSQSVVSLPFKNDPSKHFIFTNGKGGGFGLIEDNLYYSVLDMSSNGGLGDIVSDQKNILLYENITERLTITESDCNTLLIVCHESNSKNFVFIPIDDSGIQPSILQAIGSYHGDVSDIGLTSTAGVLKFDRSTSKMGIAIGSVISEEKVELIPGAIELFKFDKSSIKLAEPILIPVNDVYDFEFSPDGSVLYTVKNNKLVQYDISNHDDQLILQSEFEFSDTYINSELNFFQIERGPDNKLYFRSFNENDEEFIGVINHPNSIGMLSGVDPFHFKIPETDNTIVIPSRMKSWYSDFGSEVINVDYIEDLVLCESADTTLSVPSDATNISWSVGSEESSYLFDEAGSYYVSYSQAEGCHVVDSFEISSISTPAISLALPLSECADSNILLVPELYDSVLWNTGLNSFALTVYESGTYTATGYLGDCQATKTISLNLEELIAFSIVSSNTGCESDSTILSVDRAATSYLWSTGSVTNQIKVKLGEQYWVQLDINGCLYFDTIDVANGLELDLGGNILVCDQASAVIAAQEIMAVQYSWSTGESTPAIEVTSSGTYWLEARVGECLLRDTIEVTLASDDALDLGEMILTCHTDPITLMSNIEGETYSWSTGENSPMIDVTATGTYTLEVLSADGCIYEDTIAIVFDELSVDLGPDREICMGDSTVLSVPSSDQLSSIVWSDGSEDAELTVRMEDDYWVAVERGICFASDTILISYGTCDVMIPDTMMMDTMMTDTSMIEIPDVGIPEDQCSVYIPNAISEGASQPMNRLFQVFSNCDLSSFQISIYDRWGNLHYRTSDTLINDDDVLVQPGVYVAKIEYRVEADDELEQVLQSLTVL